MKKSRWMILCCMVLFMILSGCDNGRELEDTTLALMLGMDMDSNQHLTIYTASPVFSEEAQEPVQHIQVQTRTLGQASDDMDTRSPEFNAGKVQQILVGKQMLQHSGWFRLLDPFYRDSKWAVRANVVAVHGSVSEILHLQPKDKPILPMYLEKLMHSAGQKHMIVQTTLLDLHREMFEKGITPAIPEMRTTGQDIVMTGSALLDEDGKYVTSLSTEQSAYLNLMKGEGGQLSFNLPVPGQKKYSSFQTNRTQFYVQNPKRKIKVNYKDGKFDFNLRFELPIFFTERMFPFNVRKNEKVLEKKISKQMHQQMQKMIREFQKKQIDPIGLGTYARAYQYKEWKNVREDWGKALSKGDVDLSVNIDIRETGIVK